MSTVQYLVPGWTHPMCLQRRTRSTQQGRDPSLFPQIPSSGNYLPWNSQPPHAGELSHTLTKLSWAAIFKATLSRFAHSWRIFNDFARAVHLQAVKQSIPISTATIALFIAYLVHKGCKVTSIRSHLSAISYCWDTQTQQRVSLWVSC